MVSWLPGHSLRFLTQATAMSKCPQTLWLWGAMCKRLCHSFPSCHCCRNQVWSPWRASPRVSHSWHRQSLFLINLTGAQSSRQIFLWLLHIPQRPQYRGLSSVNQSGHVKFQLLESGARIKSVPVTPSFLVIVDSETFPTFGAELWHQGKTT